MYQPKAGKHPSDGAAMDGDAIGLRQVRNELVKRDLALGRDACLDPAGHVRQLTVAAAITPQKRRKESGLATQLDRIVYRSRRHPEVSRGLAIPVTLIDERRNARATLSDVVAYRRSTYLPHRHGMTSRAIWEA